MIIEIFNSILEYHFQKIYLLILSLYEVISHPLLIITDSLHYYIVKTFVHMQSRISFIQNITKDERSIATWRFQFTENFVRGLFA